jgi:hypothetical protein
MALTYALCSLVHTISGVTNRSLYAQVIPLLDAPYTAATTLRPEPTKESSAT